VIVVVTSYIDADAVNAFNQLCRTHRNVSAYLLYREPGLVPHFQDVSVYAEALAD